MVLGWLPMFRFYYSSVLLHYQPLVFCKEKANGFELQKTKETAVGLLYSQKDVHYYRGIVNRDIFHCYSSHTFV